MLSHQPLPVFIELWNSEKTFGNKREPITCNPTTREDIESLFSSNEYTIDYFICGTDIDNSFGGKMPGSKTTFMYALSSGFTGWETTDRGATIIRIHEDVSDSKECESRK